MVRFFPLKRAETGPEARQRESLAWNRCRGGASHDNSPMSGGSLTMKIKSIILLALLAVCGRLHAQMIQIKIENLAPASPTGLYFSPVWLGFHDGTFDLFNPGVAAPTSIEALAELGNSGLINTAFMGSQPGGQSTVLMDPAGPPPLQQFVPGHSASVTLTLNPLTQRYLSFGLMIVPSNDTFLANATPTAMPIFDAAGIFLGPQSWTFTGAQAWDAGTEINNPLIGGAFVAGVDAMVSPAEGGLIHTQPLNGLDNVIGLTTPAGTTIGQALTAAPLFRVSVAPVPEPSTYGLMGAAALLAFAVAKRWKAKRAS
jgi:hypothetical protein